jgi:hypothetical protein
MNRHLPDAVHRIFSPGKRQDSQQADWPAICLASLPAIKQDSEHSCFTACMPSAQTDDKQDGMQDDMTACLSDRQMTGGHASQQKIMLAI